LDISIIFRNLGWDGHATELLIWHGNPIMTKD